MALYGPEKWGVSICTVDGQRLSFGDATEPFTLQATRYLRHMVRIKQVLTKSFMMGDGLVTC